MANHDVSYRRLFFHRLMVTGILEFIPYRWARLAAPDSLQRVPDSMVTDRLKERRSDVVWRTVVGARQKPVYLLIEFQSSVNRWMGLRMATYSGTFSEGLVNARRRGDPKKTPPVFPLVLYNSERRWDAPLDASELYDTDTEGLELHVLRLRYHLMEVRQFRPEDLRERKNAFACLVRLENSRSTGEMEQVVADLIRWFPGQEHRALRRDFAKWLLDVLLPRRFPDFQAPENVDDLLEVKSMLAERVDQWTKEWKEEGLKAGLEEGHEKGLKEGREKGREEGLREGLRRGRQEGEAALLTQLLELRFGAVSKSQQKTILSAGPKDRKAWLRRCLTAENMNQVFNGRSAS